MPQFWFAASTEEFTPSQMLEQAQAAEAAGFDALCSSDHWAPWWPEGQGSQAWVTLAAIGQHTTLPLGTSVTPLLHHYHPANVAQAWMALEDLYPGRPFLGVGSGEALNEVPTGLVDWPSPNEKVDRLDSALDAIRRLWAGETVTMDGGWFQLKDAKLYTRSERTPPIYVSAFGPRAARVAAKHGDGLWTLGDPEQAPEVIDAYRGACEELGKEPGEIILQNGFHLAADRDAAIASTRKWKATQLSRMYVRDLYDPAEAFRIADERISDEEFATEGFIVSDDPAEHVERIRQMLAIDGCTTVCLQLIGDADPMGAIRAYGETVLPELRA